MTRREVLGVLSVLRAAYPGFYRNVSGDEAEAAVRLWCDMFSDDSPELVGAAVKALIACDTKGFPPHIGAVKEKMRQITAPRQDTEAEAWGKVLRAASRGLYHAAEDFAEFPPEIQRIVGSPNQLREWAMMDSDTVQSVVASNFQRSYRAKIRQKEEYDALPADVKQLAASIAGKIAFDIGRPTSGPEPKSLPHGEEKGRGRI